MKKFIPFILIGGVILYFIKSWVPPKYDSAFDLKPFAQLPVMAGGRIKPLDTVARTALLILRGKQSYYDENGNKRSAIEWLAHLTLQPDKARDYKVFRVDHPDIVINILKKPEKEKFFSYHDIEPHFQKIEAEIATIPEETQLQSAYEKGLIKLKNAVILHNRLEVSLQPRPFMESLTSEYHFLSTLMLKIKERDSMSEEDQNKFRQRIHFFHQRYTELAARAYFQITPPPPFAPNQKDWFNIGTSLQAGLLTGQVDRITMTYAELIEYYQAGNHQAFNETLASLQQHLKQRVPQAIAKVPLEYAFNSSEPFYTSLIIYVFVFLLSFVAWITWPTTLNKSALILIIITLGMHTLGLLTRMYLQGRPPVTNLYSSAIFIGWAAVLICIILERLYRNGIGNMTGSLIGFSTLIIAHNLMGEGDTMEMMRAVLDSNFWLATHVICISIGYSATFLAGFLAILYTIRHKLVNNLDKNTQHSIENMVYGIVCFALLFSFTGTVLGGIWADQSWGRFWGWDPKENGALLIVIWNALILHARWGGIARAQGIMNLAVFGNIVTSWSWFGTNMLGIGLHSYGFMDKAFLWLCAFWLSQLAIIAIGLSKTKASLSQNLISETHNG